MSGSGEARHHHSPDEAARTRNQRNVRIHASALSASQLERGHRVRTASPRSSRFSSLPFALRGNGWSRNVKLSGTL